MADVQGTLPVRGIRLRKSDEIVPVGKILCLGRNYAAHAREMGGAPPEEPIVFLKPPTALVAEGGAIVLPAGVRNVHHEVEMVVAIGRAGRNIPEASALEHVLGYGVGIDVTLRDLQARAREKGEPWSVSKGFDTSAPVSSFLPVRSVPDPSRLRIELRVNRSLRQQGETGNMVFAVPAILAYLSRWFTLERGDLVFTGTPEGVGPIAPGDDLDVLLARIPAGSPEDMIESRFTVREST